VKIAIENAFKYLDTFGMPLVVQMDRLEKSGDTVALDVFVRDAVNAGWTFEHAIACCREALMEKHGPVLGSECAERLELGMKQFWDRYWSK
jgi:hypothetical protein